MKTLLSPHLLRFVAVLVAGLVIDLGSAWGLTNIVGLPIVLSAVIGFLAGAVFNYILHELWTFRSSESHLSVRRAALYLSLMLLILGVRLAIITVLSPVLSGPVGSLLLLIAAAGVSFVVNYLVSRFIIYRRRSHTDRTPDVRQT